MNSFSTWFNRLPLGVCREIYWIWSTELHLKQTGILSSKMQLEKES